MNQGFIVRSWPLKPAALSTCPRYRFASMATNNDVAAEKARGDVVEYVGQSVGFTPEDAEFMKRYEGKAGKRVVRKVRMALLDRCFSILVN